ncbi:MAG TPA: aminoacyl-tRNA hydrolase [Niabella sp.]|nr:aminoacyl-tRNA hydrolase [Chitinophagaceae bacterium]HRO85800.1 aminoacyl-tRNA hydrolase [Niabella sp.]HUN04007.1 aminoacyl-tRNA hydrolase [Niabella sp.]
MKYLIAGLGNIGNEYAHTRHNIGFDVVAAFVQKHGGTFRSDRLAYVADVKYRGRLFVCICPTTYMNLSGKAVKYWLEKEKIALEKSMVVLDEISLPLSKLRINPGGSDGGHNGLRSIQELLQTTNHPRLRFGVGNVFPKGMQSEYVLGKWNKEEEALVKLKIEKAVEGIEIFAFQGINAAMNEINSKEYSL